MRKKRKTKPVILSRHGTWTRSCFIQAAAPHFVSTMVIFFLYIVFMFFSSPLFSSHTHTVANGSPINLAHKPHLRETRAFSI